MSHSAPSPALICRTNLKGQIKHCSDGFASEHGYSRGELLEEQVTLLRHELMPAPLFESLWSTLRQGTPWMGLICNRHKDGSQRWHNLYIKPVYGSEGVQGYGAIYLPVSAEQRQQAALLFARWKRQGAPVSGVSFVLRLGRRHWPVLLAGAAAGVSTQWLSSGLAQGVAAALAVVALGICQGWRQSRQLHAVLARHPKAFTEPALAEFYSDLGGPAALVNMALITEEARLQTALTRIGMSGG